MARPTDRLAYLAYRTAAELAQRVPVRVGEPAARTLGRMLSVAQPERRRIVRRNLERAYGRRRGELATRRSVAAAFESYGRYWLELFRLPTRPDEVIAGFSIEGFEPIAEATARGDGAILALPHLGGWEAAALWMTSQGHPLTAVVERVEPPELLEWFVSVRRAIGVEVIPLGPDVGTSALRTLREGKALALLCDRDLSGDGVEVEFFGERTTLPSGPALLALRTGAPLFPSAVYFRAGGGHHAVVRPPLETTRQGKLRDNIVELTQRLAFELEDLIRVAPEQWHMMQPNWPSDRTTRRRFLPTRLSDVWA
ncbi:MAG: phosphatidylinositol mannoside acyltransferase [Acidimicrobiia bacterium]|nr:phosphatidylinositol mannoside acyltransferase [Acidimicrobiia bacterium]